MSFIFWKTSSLDNILSPSASSSLSSSLMSKDKPKIVFFLGLCSIFSSFWGSFSKSSVFSSFSSFFSPISIFSFCSSSLSSLSPVFFLLPLNLVFVSFFNFISPFSGFKTLSSFSSFFSSSISLISFDSSCMVTFLSFSFSDFGFLCFGIVFVLFKSLFH